MQKLMEALKTLVGGFLAFVGLIFSIKAPWAGASLILAALLIMPPVRKAIGGKTRITIPRNVRVLVFLVLVFAFFGFVSNSGRESLARAEAEMTAQQARVSEERRKQDVAYFAKHSEEITAQVSEAIDRKEYREALTLSEKYLPYGTPKLIALNNSAKASLEAVLAAEKTVKDEELRISKTKALVEQLKTVPEAMHNRNRDLYKQLASLNSDNAKYRERYEHFQKKVSAAEEKEAKIRNRAEGEKTARIAAFGAPPLKSEWDGSYGVVESYLEQVANDPGSIDIQACTDVYDTKQGWLVGCDYRGKNSFGALVKQSNWFVIVHDRVVKMEKASAYKP